MPRDKMYRREVIDQADLDCEAVTAGRAELMEAMIGACAMIAYADGNVDFRERRRVLQLMRALPSFSCFPNEAVKEEFAQHERAFEYDPFLARDRVLETIEALKPRASEVRMLITACQHVLEADGLHHPLEYQALKNVSTALGAT